MSGSKRRTWTPAEKLRIVMEGIQKDVDEAELCWREGIKPYCPEENGVIERSRTARSAKAWKGKS